MNTYLLYDYHCSEHKIPASRIFQSSKELIVHILGWHAIESPITIQFCHCCTKCGHRQYTNDAQMNEHRYVPLKLSLQTQVADWL